ncbi:MAG: hypothetical protein M3P08_20265 [Thermoproteota archaeon]|jgi:hypothetical protein|nr:hypothetical protein [Thermoproteota archaeon]
MSSSSGSNDKFNFMLSEIEWQVVLDALSNTIFSKELTDEARNNAKELFLKLQELPRR